MAEYSVHESAGVTSAPAGKRRTAGHGEQEIPTSPMPRGGAAAPAVPLMPATPQLRWIVAVLLLVVFPLTLWWVGASATNAGLRELRDRGIDRLDFFRFSLQGELQKFEFLPRILAQNREIITLLRQGGTRDGADPINRYLERFNEISRASDTYIMDRSGLTLAASNWSQPRPFIGERFAFRPYFQQALAGNAGRYFALGTTSQRRGFYFSYPVRDGDDILGVAVIKVDAERLEKLLANDVGTVIVSGASGVIFLSTRPDWVFRSLRPLAEEERQRLRESRQYGDAPLDPLPVRREEYLAYAVRRLTIPEPAQAEAGTDAPGGGRRYLLQTSQVPDANWIIHLLTDVKPVQRAAIMRMLFAAVVMAVLVLAGGYFYQRRVNLLVRLELQRQAREALEQREAATRSIISRSRAGLITLDGEGRIDVFNPTAEQLFGCAAEQRAGRPFAELLAGPERPRLAGWLARARDGAERDAPLFETTARRADGTPFPVEMAVSRMGLARIAHHPSAADTDPLAVTGRTPSSRPDGVSATPGPSSGPCAPSQRRLDALAADRGEKCGPARGERFLVTVHDLTARKRAEGALRRAHDELEERVRLRTADLEQANRLLQGEIQERRHAEEVLRQAQDDLVQAGKLAAIGQMSAGVTHELNQPLAAIRAYADNARVLIDRQRADDAAANLGFILDLTDRMAGIIGHLKSFARKTSGEAVPVALGETVGKALALLAAHTSLEPYGIDWTPPADEVWVLGDAVRLEQVVLNLLHNALDAMRAAERRRLRIELNRGDGRGVLRVRDSGHGIPEEKLAHIFDPFFTTKEVGEGLGLGLSISNGIVRDYGGTLRAANQPDGGAVFTVELREAPQGEAAVQRNRKGVA